MTTENFSQYLYRFFHPIQVRFIETDQQGHVFFGHFLTYFDVALTEYLKAINFSYDQFLQVGVDFYYVAAVQWRWNPVVFASCPIPACMTWRRSYRA